MLELQISGLVSLKAIGLIATRMPGGAKGYSMVLIITAEGFQPIRLPMGFALAGIGGLMAIHRTCSEEALREGLRTKTLDLILFPKDPVANAPNIFAALERVFPAQRGSYILGPMLRITWGVPTIITMDLALLIEWGVRDRFIVLGRISAILPNTDNDLLRLRMDVLGVVDFDQGTVAIDAVLVDSKLLDKFVLTGAMALRMRWTSPRSFALAVGGMHRSFTPPASFPKLDRLALNLTTGSNPRLTCEAYFALTSNTVQFGAAAHLYAEGPMSFNVTGDAGFDVLITLSPFHFLAEFMASMQIRKGTRNLFKVKVEGALEGPRPLTRTRQGDLRDPVVGRLDPRQRHADQRPTPAAAAERQCPRTIARGLARRAQLARRVAGRPVAHRRAARDRRRQRCGSTDRRASAGHAQPCARRWCR